MEIIEGKLNRKMEYFDTKNYEFNTECKNGVYIIHGFTNSTYETRELAEYLGNQGFYTHAINLPGHGTTPEDCNRVKITDWLEFTEQGVAEMSARCDKVYVIGISMGSVLALHLSSVFPLNGAVFASTVLKFKDYFSTQIFTPIFHRLVPYRDKRLSYKKNVRDSLNYYGYKVWPLSALNEMRKLTNQVKKELHKIKCPALVLHSEIDLLALQENISIVYDGISSDIKEKFIVKQANHNLFITNPDQDLIFKKITSFFNQLRNN
ncbi:MAG: alpha/beta fold hydrolase [Candidatus Marinimicrobia bacterium]|nr:alpha/beta fold hydrolase [Candidatus Neomarinimicrobiota bacterium]